MNLRATNFLLVEDDHVDVMTVRRALRGSEARLWTASTGARGLEMLRGGQVPLERLIVLLDLNLPRLTGAEFLREIRNDGRLAGLPVIVLTTSEAPNDLAEAYRWNVAGYLVKPMSPEDFAEIMSRVTSYWEVMEMMK